MAKYEGADIPMDAIKYHELLDDDKEFLIREIPDMRKLEFAIDL